MSEFEAYAAATISPMLSRALADLYQQRGDSVEPVEYRTDWLKLWAAAQVAERSRGEKARKQSEYTEKVKADFREKQAKHAEEEERASRPFKMLNEVVRTVAEVDYPKDCKYCQRFPSPAVWQELTDTVRGAVAGCSGCYVGEVVTDGEGSKHLRYIANSGVAPGKARLEEGEGVVWKEVFEQQEEEEGEGESSKSRQLYLPNVMDVAEVKYFDYTKPGSFLAIPICYSSVLNKEGLEATVADMKERQAQFVEEMAAYGEAKTQYDQAVAELQEGDEAPEEPVEPVIRDLNSLEGVTRQLVLCVDTLGGEGGLLEICQQHRDKLDELCRHLGEAMADTELQAVREQAEYSTSEAGEGNRTALMAKYTEATTGEALQRMEKQVAEDIEALGEDVSDDNKEVIRLTRKLNTLRSALEGSVKTELLVDLSSRKLPEEALATLMKVVLLFLTEHDPSSFAEDTPVQWSQLVTAFHSEEVWNKMMAADLRRPRPGVPAGHTLAMAKALIEEATQTGGLKGEDGSDEEGVAQEHPVDIILLGLLEAAVQLREKDVYVRWMDCDLHKRVFEPPPPPGVAQEAQPVEGEKPVEASALIVTVAPSEAAAIDADFVPLLELDLAKSYGPESPSTPPGDGTRSDGYVLHLQPISHASVTIHGRGSPELAGFQGDLRRREHRSAETGRAIIGVTYHAWWSSSVDAGSRLCFGIHSTENPPGVAREGIADNSCIVPREMPPVVVYPPNTVFWYKSPDLSAKLDIPATIPLTDTLTEAAVRTRLWRQISNTESWRDSLPSLGAVMQLGSTLLPLWSSRSGSNG
ncbi:hypothetical protein FOZ61_010608 [Perkinsus olseni]|uniref:Uncharacterized protein n=1 Tax=Perkinsus olseni TaxID=32597 RepID=A0A7J6M2N6_PEROL|nr:hypothetical protein FOZ61_010608 [Perkinsus olseni]